MYPFRMYGRKIEVYRYKVDYAEYIPHEDEMSISSFAAATAYFPTLEEAQYFAGQNKGTVSEVDNNDSLWIDGIIVADVPNTYAEAVRIYEMGRAGYERMLAFEASKKNEQLRADLDYVMLMGGL